MGKQRQRGAGVRPARRPLHGLQEPVAAFDNNHTMSDALCVRVIKNLPKQLAQAGTAPSLHQWGCYTAHNLTVSVLAAACCPHVKARASAPCCHMPYRCQRLLVPVGPHPLGPCCVRPFNAAAATATTAAAVQSMQLAAVMLVLLLQVVPHSLPRSPSPGCPALTP